MVGPTHFTDQTLEPAQKPGVEPHAAVGAIALVDRRRVARAEQVDIEGWTDVEREMRRRRERKRAFQGEREPLVVEAVIDARRVIGEAAARPNPDDSPERIRVADAWCDHEGRTIIGLISVERGVAER